MGKKLQFYVPQGEPVMKTDYTLRTTKNGRRQAVAMHKGRKLYRFVSKDFKK
jgi:hypothetical protein